MKFTLLDVSEKVENRVHLFVYTSGVTHLGSRMDPDCESPLRPDPAQGTRVDPVAMAAVTVGGLRVMMGLGAVMCLVVAASVARGLEAVVVGPEAGVHQQEESSINSSGPGGNGGKLGRVQWDQRPKIL